MIENALLKSFKADISLSTVYPVFSMSILTNLGVELTALCLSGCYIILSRSGTNKSQD